MSTIGTFDGFTAARLGIYAAQQGLSVTGNNISNINTTGYTRQVLDQISLKTGAYDRYRSQFDNHIGTGTLVRNINQIRDPYLDVRFRNTSADVGYSDAMLDGLDQIATILDEVGRGKDGSLGDGMLYAQLRDLYDQLHELQDNPVSGSDTLVRESANALVSLFNTYAKKLETLRQNTEKELKQEVTDVNEILRNIRELNEDIREAELHGDGALELRDERNRQIDELSSKLPISAVYTMEDIGGGRQIEKLSIYLNNANPDPTVKTDESMLVDGIYAAQINIPEKMPMTNPNWGKEPTDDGYDPKFADVGKEYQYYMTKTDGTLVGTNDPALADQSKEDNSNYLITIGKLLDSKDREWEKPTTTWTNYSLADADKGKKATYSVALPTLGTLADGDTITLNGRTFTVGRDSFTADIANDPAKLGKFIASQLNGRVDKDYIISADDTGNLIYTAKLTGAIGKTGPATEPSPLADIEVTTTPAGGTATTTPVAFGPATETQAGVDDKVPQNTETTDPYGTVTNISYARDSKGQWYEVKTVTEHTKSVMLDDNDLNGSIQAIRELLTENGEFATVETKDTFDENALSKRGIPYYQKSFDLLAQQFAKSFNDLNKGYMVDKDGNYLKKDGSQLKLDDIESGQAEPVNKKEGLTAGQAQNLINDGYFKKDSLGNQVLVEGKPVADLDRWLDEQADTLKIAGGAGNLFSCSGDSDDAKGITAANISVSQSWRNRTIKVVPTTVELFGGTMDHTTQGENIGHMITLIDKDLVYNPNDLNSIIAGGKPAAGDNLFIGSFNDMFSNMCTVLGNDQRTTNVELTSDYTSLLQIDTNRDGVSGVDLNDEAMNMMQYQKAYTAACRLMTAVDEALDRLINNTGIAGR